MSEKLRCIVQSKYIVYTLKDIVQMFFISVVITGFLSFRHSLHLFKSFIRLQLCVVHNLWRLLFFPPLCLTSVEKSCKCLLWKTFLLFLLLLSTLHISCSLFFFNVFQTWLWMHLRTFLPSLFFPSMINYFGVKSYSTTDENPVTGNET